MFQSQRSRGAYQEEERSNLGGESVKDIQIEEILVGCIPSPLRTYTHYYVDIEDAKFLHHNASNDFSTRTNPSVSQPCASQPCTQFLRVRQIQMSKDLRPRSEPLIDYSHSQVLTFEAHF